MTDSQLTTQDSIKTLFERNARALELRSSLGRGTARTKVSRIDGFECVVEDGEWSLVIDMGTKSGGTNKGPNPGVIGRGALGTCLVMAYVQWAAKLEVPLEKLEVLVEADYDTRGEYGVGDARPDYESVRCKIDLKSPAPKEKISELRKLAEAHCPYLWVFRTAQDVTTELNLDSEDD